MVVLKLLLFGGLIWFPLAVVSRMIVTVGRWDEAIEIIQLPVGTTWNNIAVQPSQAFSFSIWIVVFLIASYLSKGIQRVTCKSLSSSQFVKQILSMRSMLISFVTFLVICYELWMLAYIYGLYVVRYAFDIQLIYCLPTVALILNTLHQPYLLVCTPQCTKDANKCTNFMWVIATGACFNGIYALHVLCMGITGYCTSTSVSNINCEKYIVIALGTVELFYRIWATLSYIKLWKIHKGKPVTIRMEHPVEESSISHKAEFVVKQRSSRPTDYAQSPKYCASADNSYTNVVHVCNN